MIPVGAAMTNYAWCEAQWEELRAAGRAAVAAAAALERLFTFRRNLRFLEN